MAKKGQKSIEGIIREKRAYDAAKENGDREGMDAAEAAASEHYRVLEKSRDPKDREAASALHAADAAGAEGILYRYATDGKTAVRDYMGEALKKEGLSFDQKDLTYDDQSGEVRYKGVSMGVPDYVSADGVSYADREWVDSFIQREFGTSPKSDDYYKEGHSRAALRNSQNRSAFLESLTDGSFRASVGQDIMDRYRYDGQLAAADELADAASYSAGNLDSFGAANAARQMLSYQAAGDQAVRSEIQTILGGYAQADEGEYKWVTGYDGMMRENRKEERENLTAAAERSGALPAADYTDPKLNPYLNADGTAKEEIGDYAGEMDGVLVRLEDEDLSESARADLLMTYNYLNAARNAKMEASSEAMAAGRGKAYGYQAVPTDAVRARDAEAALTRYGIDVGKELTEEEYGADLLGTVIKAYSDQAIANGKLTGQMEGMDMSAYLPSAGLKSNGSAEETSDSGASSASVSSGDRAENDVSEEEKTAGEFIAEFIRTEGATPTGAANAAYEKGIPADGIAAYLKRHYGISWQVA